MDENIVEPKAEKSIFQRIRKLRKQYGVGENHLIVIDADKYSVPILCHACQAVWDRNKYGAGDKNGIKQQSGQNKQYKTDAS